MFKKHDKPSPQLQAAAQLRGLSLFYGKYYGKEEVPQPKGSSVVEYALHEILLTKQERAKQGWKAPRVEISIGTQGVKVVDRYSLFSITQSTIAIRTDGKVFLDLELKDISYCQDERRGNNLFCFIAKENEKAPRCCYAFKTYNQAHDVIACIGSAFTKA